MINRLASLMIRRLPRDFVRAYGDDMLATLDARLADAQRRGTLRFALVFAREIAGLLRIAIVEQARSGNPFANLSRELRIAPRRLLRTPGFTIAVVTTLALALGVNLLGFTLLQQTVLAPLPYPASDRLIALDHAAPGVGLRSNLGMSIGVHLEYAKLSSIERIALYDVAEGTITGEQPAERVNYVFSTPALGDILGIRPTIGRWFTPEEGVAGGPPAVLISDALWHRNFGASRKAIGRSLRVDGASYDIVGVLPRGFAFADPSAQFVMALPLPKTWNRAAGFNYQGIARVARGKSIDDVRREQDAVLADLSARYPADPERATGIVANGRLTSRAEWFKDRLVGTTARALWILFGAAVLVLVIACANLANLFVVRAEGREREVALRRAIGANGDAVAALFLSDSIALAVVGGLAGLLIATAGLGVFVRKSPIALPRLYEVHVSAGTIAFGFALTIATSVLLGAAALWRHRQRGTSLHVTERVSTRRGAKSARHLLVGAQLSIGVVMLASAGLLVRSFANLLRVNPGFDERSRLVFRVGLPRAQYRGGNAAAAFQNRMLEELRALPGVRDAAFTSTLPLDGQGLGNPIEVRGVPAGSADATPVVRARRVSANYFATMNIRVIAGGFVNTNGLPNGPHPVVVNQALVARYFGLTNPLGREIRPLGGGNEEWLTITGVVANTVTYDLRETSPVPQMFVSLTDSARANLPAPQDGVIVLQTANDPTSVIASVRQRLASLDPNVAMARPERLTDVVERSRAPMLFAMILAVLAATVALTLAVVGTYSVIAYGVAQRRAEIGVRLALGATPRAVTSMIIRDSGRTIVAGVVLGALGGLASARLLSSFVFDVAPADAWTHAGGALGLLVVALVACWIPARRAGRLDPVTVLGRG